MAIRLSKRACWEKGNETKGMETQSETRTGETELH